MSAQGTSAQNSKESLRPKTFLTIAILRCRGYNKIMSKQQESILLLLALIFPVARLYVDAKTYPEISLALGAMFYVYHCVLVLICKHTFTKNRTVRLVAILGLMCAAVTTVVFPKSIESFIGSIIALVGYVYALLNKDDDDTDGLLAKLRGIVKRPALPVAHRQLSGVK